MNPLLESDEMEDIEGMYMDYSPEELELPVLAFDFEDGEYIAEDDLEMHRPAERDDFSILSEEDVPRPTQEPKLIELDDLLPQREEEEAAPAEAETEPFNFEALDVTDLKTNISEEDRSRRCRGRET